MSDLLYEIGAEELPAGYIEPALAQLRGAMTDELAAARLTHGDITLTATPRRLTLFVAAVADRQPDAEEEVLGPSVKAAYDAQGAPTKAAQGFARSQGVDPAQLLRKMTPRGEYCYVRKQIKGRPAAEVLAEILPRIAARLAFPKSMVWLPERKPFARPVRSLMALLDAEVVPFTLFGVASGRATEGHPILSPGRIDLPRADLAAYREALRARCVVVDLAERKAAIRAALDRACAGVGVVSPDVLDRLLDEIKNLVQYPSVTLCGFHADFLNVPDMVTKAAMTEHQRYFPIEGPDGRLRPNFLVVSDRGPDHADLIRLGNEKVLHARLSDAQFFDRKDRDLNLRGHVEGLRGVAFLKGLGSYYDKTERLKKLVDVLADPLGADATTLETARKAAALCKADLLTEIVGEFPALQGEISRVYAVRDGQTAAVGAAIAEHYMPRAADAALPETPAGVLLSLAEKIDNLVSCFALGLLPSGSQDPYALRRQAQALARIIEKSGRRLQLLPILRAAQALLPEPHARAPQAVDKLMDFLRDRLFQMALDRGAPHDLINAALGAGFDDLCDFQARLDALRKLAAEPGWQELVAAVERTGNISKSAPAGGAIDPALFAEPLERDLGALLARHGREIEQLESDGRYTEASHRYAQVFGATLHDFFSKVFVNVDDLRVRENRLRLLREINRLYTARIGDLSQIVTGTQNTPR
jgi:glycyl-tRNA synthetase beta chain